MLLGLRGSLQLNDAGITNACETVKCHPVVLKTDQMCYP